MPKRVTTKDFIERARSVHGDRYDYSLSTYQGNHTHVTIVCSEHGPFRQSPANHYAGKGCPDCGGSKRHTVTSFVEAAKEIHGDKYDYSQVEYRNNKATVTIICPTHGSFSQVAAVHLRGNGCPDCGGNRKHSLDSFIDKGRAVHGDRYDYSQVVYAGAHERVPIICPEHGPFMQSPSNHFAGKGCPDCGYLATADARRKTTEEFIARAEIMHGGSYDYSLVEYLGSATKVKIVCTAHGVFTQTPNDHLTGYGCPKCGSLAAADARRKTTEEFIARAKAVHGDRYDYSLVEYLSSQEKVTIICPEHGPFQQAPNGHYEGKGCAACAQKGFNPNEPALLYYVAITADDGDTRYKIGITNRSVEERFPSRDLARIRVVRTWRFSLGHAAAKRESEILYQFAGDRYYGPQLLVGAGDTELFTHDVLGLDTGEHLESAIDETGYLSSRPTQSHFDF